MFKTLAIGNLGQDSKPFMSGDGSQVLSFSIAVNTGSGDYKKNQWIDCVLFGKRAKACCRTLKKAQKFL